MKKELTLTSDTDKAVLIGDEYVSLSLIHI